jgi:hypothetical protein
MNAAESKALKKGNRVYWRGDATDSGNYHRIELGCSHDRLGQWSGGHRTPWGHARDPASPSKAYSRIKAYYCVGILCPVGVLLLAQSGRAPSVRCPLLALSGQISRTGVCSLLDQSGHWSALAR